MTEIKQHIQAAGSAQITMSLGEFPEAHTVEAYHVEKIDNTLTKICTTDPNHSNITYQPQDIAEENSNNEVYCPTFITVNTRNFEYMYNGKRIKDDSFQVDNQSERLLNENIDSLVDFCKEERGCE